MDQDDEAGFALVAAEVDAAFYRAHHPDVAAARADPAEHYWATGWRERRNPSDWFDTDFYLRVNPDVRQLGCNPLWHFLVQGRGEGRQPRPAEAWWRTALARGRAEPVELPRAPRLSARALRAALADATALVVSISHDRYVSVPGGTQLLISDEQRKFNSAGARYLHLSPLAAGLGLARPDDGPQDLHVILDGRSLGDATDAEIAEALPAGARRLLVLHVLHGHRPERILALAEALRPDHSFFWVHDYGTACASPQLLRNDIAFCDAPPPASMACRICMHGETREADGARLHALFSALRPHVVAPSATALALWRRAADLPHASARVHPHVTLRTGPMLAPSPPGAAPRVAFVGHAAHHKGWERFRALVAAGGAHFHQFADAAALQPLHGVTRVAATTSAAQPFGMARALAAHRIDFVLALSPWPETFGYVAHEALAAGADVVTTAASGHVAELVRQTGRGVVLDSDPELMAFFAEGAAAAHLSGPRPGMTMQHTGSTATLSLGEDAETRTADPNLQAWHDGAALPRTATADGWSFALPGREGAEVRLRSRHVWPVWESIDGVDPRRLGVAVAGLWIDDAPLPPHDPRLLGGWHGPEAGWRWTDGDAGLRVGAARRLRVSLRPLAQYWRAPLLP